MKKKKTRKIRNTVDRSTTTNRIMRTMKQAILDRMSDLERVPHSVARELGMRPATLYDFLTKPETTMKSDKLELIFGLLGLEVRPKDKR